MRLFLTVIFLVTMSVHALASEVVVGSIYDRQNCKGSGYDYTSFVNGVIGSNRVSVQDSSGFNYSNGNCYQAYGKACPIDYPSWNGDLDTSGKPMCTETPPCELPNVLYEPDPVNQPGFMICGIPPPVCEAPDYIDVVSGECVSPEEVCYTDIESMADECVLIGNVEGDNCVTNESGLQLCLGDNPLCYEANGKTVCPDKDSICGEKNGSFQCVAPEEEGCGLFNGERVCFTPDGDKVEPDSPDHPDNGGNLDGDDSNDITDPRPPEEGGDPDNQPNQPSEPTSDADRASEKTAKESLGELRDINKNIKKNTDSIKSEIGGLSDDLTDDVSDSEKNAIIQNGATGEWDDPATGTWSQVQDHVDGIGANDGNAIGDGLVDGIGSSVTGLIDQGSCVDLGFTFKGHQFGLPCDKTKKIRDLLSWVFYALTIWALFDIVTQPHVRRA